jgi:hypothetical protein
MRISILGRRPLRVLECKQILRRPRELLGRRFGPIRLVAMDLDGVGMHAVLRRMEDTVKGERLGVGEKRHRNRHRELRLC